MKITATPQKLGLIRNDFIDGICDKISSRDELEEIGFSRELAESTIEIWEDLQAIARGAQAGNDLITELYGRVEAMARANPILQTLKSISVKLERITNQADRLDALLIPFAGPYPDLPTLRFLENLCSAIDDLPLPFVNHFSTELDMLRVHSRTTEHWLNMLKPDEPEKSFDSGSALRHELHKVPEPRETAGDKIFWLCKKCGEMNHDTDLCKCGGRAPWGVSNTALDDEPRETVEGDFRWVCEKCGKVNDDVDLCECGEMSTWRKLAINSDKRNKYPY